LITDGVQVKKLKNLRLGKNPGNPGKIRKNQIKIGKPGKLNKNLE